MGTEEGATDVRRKPPEQTVRFATLVLLAAPLTGVALVLIEEFISDAGSVLHAVYWSADNAPVAILTKLGPDNPLPACYR